MSTKQKRLANARKQKIRISNVLKFKNATLVEVLLDPPECLARVSVWTVLLRAPGLAEAGAKRVLTQAQVWPEDKIGSLDDKARQRIVNFLPQRAKGGGL